APSSTEMGSTPARSTTTSGSAAPAITWPCTVITCTPTPRSFMACARSRRARPSSSSASVTGASMSRPPPAEWRGSSAVIAKPRARSRRAPTRAEHASALQLLVAGLHLARERRHEVLARDAEARAQLVALLEAIPGDAHQPEERLRHALPGD